MGYRERFCTACGRNTAPTDYRDLCATCGAETEEPRRTPRQMRVREFPPCRHDRENYTHTVQRTCGDEYPIVVCNDCGETLAA